MFTNTLLMAIREIQRNVMRSGLTVLGIIIGVAAVIVIVTLGAGTTQQVGSEISKMGSNMLTLMPGGDMRMGGAAVSAPPFVLADVDAIRREVYGLAAIAPYSQKLDQIVIGNENRRVNIVGTTADISIVRSWKVTQGRLFTPSEERAGKNVCIIGSTIAKEMLAGQEPIGASVRVGKVSCEVIGVLEPKGQAMFGGDQDATIVLPIRTYQRRLSGSGDKVAQIFISGEDQSGLSDLKAQLTQVMRERRHIQGEARSDFNIMDMTEVSNVMQNTIGIMTTFLSAIAAVSLLVGGIGIMNIMLVSVTERTKEIGLRQAVGAKTGDILGQFLVEAVTLSLLGGTIGVIMGVLTSLAISVFAGWNTLVSIPSIIAAVAFSGLVGIFFGYYPARKAAFLDPIEALRYE